MTYRLTGYLYITIGLLIFYFFVGYLLLQLFALLVGLGFMLQGLRLLAVDRFFYHQSINYFNDQFKR